MNNDLSNAINDYLEEKDSDGYLYSGPILRELGDKLVKLIDHRSDRRKNVCLFLTTFGGDPNTAYRIGRALQANYGRGRTLAILGGYCKSAGTLLSLSADELSFGCFGELGPLDTQIDKPNEILGSESGLDLLQALNQLGEATFQSFEQQMMSIISHYQGTITTSVAAEIASSLTVGIFSPISAQIDPLRIGVVKRAIQIGLKYGERLASKNVRVGTVEKLVNDYPAHGFVIDQQEAEKLFFNVRGFDEGESLIYSMIDHVLRIPDKNGFVSDLRTDFLRTSSNDQGGEIPADQSSIGVDDAKSEFDQPGDQEGSSGDGAAEEG